MLPLGTVLAVMETPPPTDARAGRDTPVNGAPVATDTSPVVAREVVGWCELGERHSIAYEHRQTNRQTDTQIDKQTGRQVDRQTDRQRDRQTDTHTHTHTHR